MSAEYTPIEQAPQTPETTENEENGNESCCFRVFCWIFQILVWISIIISIVLCSLIREAPPFCLGFYGFFFLIYAILELCSPICTYLCIKESGEEIPEKMRKIFKSNPNISLHYEAYHYETRTETTTDEDGNETTTTYEEKETTFRESFSIPYYSSRDVSGLFYLNSNKDLSSKRIFIKLTIKGYEINFADTISYMDYELYKKNFRLKKRPTDTYVNFWETRTIPPYNKQYFSKIGNKDPCTVNFCFYFLSIIFTVCQLYKRHVNSFCVSRSFTIRKIVSTRYDLSKPEYDEKYAQLVPYLNLITKQIVYEPNDFNYLNQDYNVNLPTKEELDKAMIYEKKIPNYIVSSCGENTQAGVILDNPNYSSFEKNFKPEEYIQDQGKDDNNALQNVVVGSDLNQINVIDTKEQGYSSTVQGQENNTIN